MEERHSERLEIWNLTSVAKVSTISGPSNKVSQRDVRQKWTLWRCKRKEALAEARELCVPVGWTIEAELIRLWRRGTIPKLLLTLKRGFSPSLPYTPTIAEAWN